MKRLKGGRMGKLMPHINAGDNKLQQINVSYRDLSQITEEVLP